MAFNEDFAPACPNCGGPTVHFDLPNEEEHHLRTENARLRDEIGRLSQISRSHVHGGSDQDCATESDKPLIFELAVVAMEELMGMAQQREPLWVPIPDSSSEILREEEYFRTSFGGHKPNPLGFKSEASRDHAIVAMNHMNLVEILMDVNEWSSVFHGIVSRANTLEVLFAGVAGTYHGALQEISAEYQLPSPLVPTRKHYFVRYCKQQGNGTWAVVDFCPSPVPSCRKRPSGCLIQELPSGYSKVIWVEHVEIDDGEVHNVNMYEDLVSSAMGFGAKRWVAILDQHCQRLASALATNIPSVEAGVITSLEGRQNIMELAERMMKSFSLGVGSSTALSWTKLSGSGADDARVMMLKNMDDPHKPPGIVLSTTSSFWMPIAPKRVFNFLRDENSRGHWDILSTGCIVQESGHIANSRDPANCISLLQVNGANWIQNNMMIMQESCTDATGSYVVYAPVDIVAINMLLNGGDPDIVALLPSGFAILPDGPPPDLNSGPTGLMDAGFGGGSLVTVAFQILVDPVPTARLSLESVAAVNNLIKSTVEKIKEALACEGA